MSSATIPKSSVPTYAIGRFPTHQTSGDAIRGILQRHGIATTGRKEELLEKLIELAVKLYEGRRSRLDEFFTKQRYVRINGVRDANHQEFPVFNGLDLKNLVLNLRSSTASISRTFC